MKSIVKAILVAVCTGALLVGVVGCASGGSASASGSSASGASGASSAAVSSASSASASSVSGKQPVANVNPADIDPGQGSGAAATDVWHLNGNASSEGVRFEKYDNEAGLMFVRVSAAGQDGDKEFNLVITDEKHLRTPMGTAPKIDFVFTDAKNCYDYVTGNWYTRS